MSEDTQTEDRILAISLTIAVVGLSPHADRDSHQVARYMQEQGYRIIPVNPTVRGRILGERVYASLTDVPVPVDVVDVFRRSEQTDEPIDGAIAIGAKAVWLQLDIRNPAGLARARAAGLLATEDRCLLIEHRRWQAEREASA